MSLGPRPELVAEGVVSLGPWSRLVAAVALFLRFSLGLGLVNTGLAAVLTQNGGGPGFGARGLNPFVGNATAMQGMDGLAQVLPFAELVVGVGLIFGIFTTICALAACALSLVMPLMMSLTLMMNAGIGPAPNRFGYEFLLLGGLQSTLADAVLVLLSPVAINRYSMDALIFARNPRRPFPQRNAPAEAGEPAP